MNQYRKHLLVLSVCAVSLLMSSWASAQNDFDAFYNRYLFDQLNQSARSAAMGGVYSALQGGEMGLVGNPASLGFLEERYVHLDLTYEEIGSDTSITGGPFAPPTSVSAETNAELYNPGVGLAYPFEWGGLSVQYNYLDSELDSDPFRFSNNTFALDGNMERHMVSFGGGYRADDAWAVGYRYSYINWDNDTNLNMTRPLPAVRFARVTEEYEGHRNQIGAQYRFSDNLIFGIDGRYTVGDRKSNLAGNADSDSFGIRGGVAWSAFDNIPLLLSLDLNYENRELDGGGNNIDEDLFSLHLGAEYEVVDNLFLRAGYRFEDFDYDDSVAGIHEDPTNSGFSAGFGYQWNQFSLDYGFVYTDHGSGDMIHVVGIGIRF